MKKYLLWGIVLLVGAVMPTFAYELSDTDYGVIDHVEERILDMVDADPSMEIEDVVEVLIAFGERKRLSEKSEAILEVLIDDMLWYAGYDMEDEDYETLTAEDCYDDEYFDAEDERCYLIDESMMEGDYDEYDDEEDLMDFGYEGGDHEDFGDHQEDIELDAVYTVGTQGLVVESGDEEGYHAESWEQFSALFPHRTVEPIAKVGFFASDDGTIAYVERLPNDHTQWLIAFNIDEIAAEDPTETYVHEMAHIITLHHNQIKAVTPSDASEETMERHAQKCDTHYEYEGCLRENAYFYAFVQAFRTQEMIDASYDEQDLYTGNEDDFVTEYASTNAGEDIAESFAVYVMKPDSHGVSGLAGEKIDFFNQYPELVELRKAIRSQITKNR